MFAVKTAEKYLADDQTVRRQYKQIVSATTKKSKTTHRPYVSSRQVRTRL